MNPGLLLRAAPELARVSLARLVAYRAEMAIWIFSALMPLIMLFVWDSVASDGPVGQYGQTEFTRYFTATLVVRQMTGVWITWQLNYEIRKGGLSARLLRPIHPLYSDAIWMLTAIPFRLVVLAPLLGILVLWRPELLIVPELAVIPLFVVSVLLAWTMAFLAQAFFGLLSFWFDQSIALFGVYFMVYTVLSGYVAPLDVFPAWAQGPLDWLPFRGMLAVPVELLSGFLSPAEALQDIGIQVAWTAVLSLLVWWTWKQGIKRYGAFGA